MSEICCVISCWCVGYCSCRAAWFYCLLLDVVIHIVVLTVLVHCALSLVSIMAAVVAKPSSQRLQSASVATGCCYSGSLRLRPLKKHYIILHQIVLLLRCEAIFVGKRDVKPRAMCRSLGTRATCFDIPWTIGNPFVTKGRKDGPSICAIFTLKH